MTEQQAIEFLTTRRRLGAQKNPDTMRALMRLLEDPQDKLQFVHITGTNGKGSTARMIACILTAAGYKTGLNISPYVQNFKERMTIDGVEIGARELGQVTRQVQKAARQLEQEGLYATAFECTTAAALLWYAQSQCDLVVLEVGIGGRQDATNIIKNTQVACILQVSLDHTDRLGTTVEEIAQEKCGIFKPGCTVVAAGGQLPGVQKIIEERASALKLPLRQPELEDIKVLWSTLRETHIDYGGYEVSLQLAGAHQAGNAAVAVETALALCDKGYEIDDDSILKGLGAAKLPCRIEMLRYDPLFVVDGSHNPGGGAALAASLKAAKVKNTVAVIGMMRDKDAVHYLDALRGCFAQVYTVRASQDDRSFSAQELAAICKGRFARVLAKESLEQALADAQKDGQGVVVCGSFYLAGRAKTLFG